MECCKQSRTAREHLSSRPIQAAKHIHSASPFNNSYNSYDYIHIHTVHVTSEKRDVQLAQTTSCGVRPKSLLQNKPRIRLITLLASFQNNGQLQDFVNTHRCVMSHCILISFVNFSDIYKDLC